jgi:hypothetical protein
MEAIKSKKGEAILHKAIEKLKRKNTILLGRSEKSLKSAYDKYIKGMKQIDKEIKKKYALRDKEMAELLGEDADDETPVYQEWEKRLGELQNLIEQEHDVRITHEDFIWVEEFLGIFNCRYDGTDFTVELDYDTVELMKFVAEKFFAYGKKYGEEEGENLENN